MTLRSYNLASRCIRSTLVYWRQCLYYGIDWLWSNTHFRPNKKCGEYVLGPSTHYPHAEYRFLQTSLKYALQSDIFWYRKGRSLGEIIKKISPIENKMETIWIILLHLLWQSFRGGQSSRVLASIIDDDKDGEATWALLTCDPGDLTCGLCTQRSRTGMSGSKT